MNCWRCSMADLTREDLDALHLRHDYGNCHSVTLKPGEFCALIRLAREGLDASEARAVMCMAEERNAALAEVQRLREAIERFRTDDEAYYAEATRVLRGSKGQDRAKALDEFHGSTPDPREALWSVLNTGEATA